MGNQAATSDPLRDLAAGGLRQARRLVIAVTGGAVLLAGAVMLLTPGPGLVGIALGLMILGAEFTWARRLLIRVKRKMRTMRAAKNGSSPSESPASEDPNGLEDAAQRGDA